MNRLDYILASLRRAAENGYAWSVSPDEATAVVAEVERLRGEVSLLQQEARIRRNISDGLAAEVAAERAAVVAWLHHAADARYYDCCCGPVAACADAIERGEHRREETK